MRFAKYQGLGNDFIIVDRRGGGAALGAEQVRRLCDRHRGIGADGVLTVWPAPGAAARMQVQNADGSESGMCGNGLRCVARWLYDSGALAPAERQIRLAAGERHYATTRLSASRFRVEMGRASGTHPELPTADASGEVTLSAAGRSFRGTALWVGNPHFVTFVEEEPRALAERFGAALEAHPAYPCRANVSFARLTAGGVQAVVYERGVGITEACASGACAIGVAAVQRGRWPAGTPLEVRLPGGALVITAAADGEVAMEGEALAVFAGETDLGESS